MITVHELTKHYGNVLANDRITFQVKRGEIVGLLGPNGAGKSTIMRILTGCIPATSGLASIGGYDLMKEPTQAKQQLGYLPEFVPLYPEMTVPAYLEFLGRLRGLKGRHVRAAVDEVIERCGLVEMRRRLIRNLSKGYQQRLGLAQALVHQPSVLILDEPTGGLDPRQTHDMRQLIRRLAGSHTILLSTHILAEATALCQRVVIIHAGRLVAVDEQERLAARLRHSEKLLVQLRHPPKDLQAQLRSISGVLGCYREYSDGHDANKDLQHRWIIECALGKDLSEVIGRCAVLGGWGLVQLSPISMSLEDVFLKLTRGQEMEMAQ